MFPIYFDIFERELIGTKLDVRLLTDEQLSESLGLEFSGAVLALNLVFVVTFSKETCQNSAWVTLGGKNVEE